MMFGDVARRVLKLMGQSGNIPGGVSAENIAGALEQLQKAVTLEGEPPEAGEEGEQAKVGMAARAYPIIEMLKAAAREETSIMWTEA